MYVRSLSDSVAISSGKENGIKYVCVCSNRKSSINYT